MIITLTKDGYLLLADLFTMIDIEKIKKYSLKQNKGGTLTLKFYDKKGKVIKPYGKGKPVQK